MTDRYPEVSGWFDPIELEESMLETWNRERVFEKLREQNERGEPWSFIDGPITANNPMGIHHAWGRSLKDAFQRYHAMNGRSLRYQNGFDCQGLWVEVEVEKELGFTSKRDIETYGVARFVERCKERARNYARVITDQSKRLGYWMDWDHSYYTMSDENNYAIWNFLKRCSERDLIYRGHDVMPWCPRCGTGLSQHEMSEGYKDVTHTSLYVGFPLRHRPNRYLAIWTTTPWTLPANGAVAANPEIEYVEIAFGDRIYYASAASAKKLLRILSAMPGTDAPSDPPRVLRRLPGAELVALDSTYDAPFDDLPGAAESADSHRIVPWSEIEEDEGTGLVHIAPGCGEADHALGAEFDIPSISPINDSGRFVEGFGPLAGVPTDEAARIIIERLRECGMLIGVEEYLHSYPHCWRCSTELVYRLVDEWFIAMDPWRNEIMRSVEQASWIPGYGKELELDWLRNMSDWMISKKRYWGLALPIWVDDGGGRFVVVGSREELERRAVSGWEEFEGHSPHRPWIDRVKIAGPDGRIYSRIPDVGNPWLDAGIVPYSTLPYSEDRAEWSKWAPADLVLESFPGQFRNWFYSLLAMSTMLEGKSPFRTLVGHATVRDEHGEEMHKSAGNAIWFDDAVEKSGSEVLRWLFFSHDLARNINFSYEIATQIRGGFINSLWNAHVFFVNYARIADFRPSTQADAETPSPIIDRWILAELRDCIGKVRSSMESYDTRSAAFSIERFVEKLTNWYIRRSRRRFWRTDGDHEHDSLDAFHTLYRSLETLSRLVAPFLPMLADTIYRNVTAATADRQESVHLCPFPRVEEIDAGASADADAGADAGAGANDSVSVAEIRREMEFVIEAATTTLKARKDSGIRIRQPLPLLTVSPGSSEGADAIVSLSEILRDEVNVKRVEVVPPETERPSVRRGRLDLRVVGREFGALTPALVDRFNARETEIVDEINRRGESKLEVGETAVTLKSEHLSFEERAPDHLSISELPGGWLALDTRIDHPLELEGIARDLIRRIQVIRKEAGLAIEDRIRLRYRTLEPIVSEAIEAHRETIAAEVLATSFASGDVPGSARRVDLEVGHINIEIEPDR